MNTLRVARFVAGPHAGRVEHFRGELPSMLTREATAVDCDGKPWEVLVVYERDRVGCFRPYRVEVGRNVFGFGPVVRI